MGFGRVAAFCKKLPSFVAVDHRPIGPLFRRCHHFHDDVIGSSGRRQNSGARESSTLPRVVLGQFPSTVVQMKRQPGILGVCPHNKPVIVALEKGMGYRFLLSEPEISPPLIVADDIALLDIRIHRLNRTCDRVVERGIRRRKEGAKPQ
jgi:hypothetical protein